jgi:DNA modification methylase
MSTRDNDRTDPQGPTYTLHQGDSLETLKTLPAESISALVTDPPYGLGTYKEADVRACLSAWTSGETWNPPTRGGFMGKAWDSWTPPPELWREVWRVMKHGAHGLVFASARTQDLMGISLRLAGFEIRDTLQWLYSNGFPNPHNVEKATGDTQWKGYGTALKPAFEPIILIRKPLNGSIKDTLQKHGTGALNIDAGRIDTKGEVLKRQRTINTAAGAVSMKTQRSFYKREEYIGHKKGRYPSNVLIDTDTAELLGDKARFYYCPKAKTKEREAGLEAPEGQRANTHPTIKPLELMRYLTRLITPPQGIVLDPFTGSGSTGAAAMLEGFDFVGVEREPEYVEIARQRLDYWRAQAQADKAPSQPTLF